MKFLQILERLWVVAAVVAFIIFTINLLTYKAFDHHVYFPLMVGIACVILYFTKRSHRRFMENFNNKNGDPVKTDK